MRWQLARKKRAKHAQPREAAVIVAVSTPLNRETARDLRRQVDLVNPEADVVIDLTAIPSFDSDGADALFDLQTAHPDGRVSIVGFRQATARLIAPEAPVPVPSSPAASPGSAWVIRRLRNLVVVQPAEPSAPNVEGLEDIVTVATTDVDAAIIVIDLRGVTQLPVSGVETIAFASSTAALRGQELLVVNVAAEAVETLRAAGLSATTFVAPEPFGQPAPYGDSAIYGDGAAPRRNTATFGDTLPR
jgi:anti-anti-sigma regulatory factor